VFSYIHRSRLWLLFQHHIGKMPPSLAPIITPTLLSTIRRHPHLPRQSWYFIAATTLSILNRPDEIPKVYQTAIGSTPELADEKTPEREEQLTISRRMREALVKAAAIGGLPKVYAPPNSAARLQGWRILTYRLLDHQCSTGSEGRDASASH
jgi:hypothetical protein